MESEDLFSPSKLVKKQQIEHSAGDHHIYICDRLSPYIACCYFKLKFSCHTPKSIISLSLKCMSKYLLTCLQSIALIGHTKDLNLSTLHSTLKLLFLLDMSSNKVKRCASPTTQPVRQWHSLSTGLITCPPGSVVRGQYLQYR